MSPAILLSGDHIQSDEPTESQYQRGVKHLYEKGIERVPNKYILPFPDRPNTGNEPHLKEINIDLPVIDFAQLQGPNRSQVLKELANACQQYGFFQVVNHGIPADVIANMMDVFKRFFELPFDERVKYMSSDLKAPVRYGTSFNQNKDGFFCWRDFLKLVCHPLPEDVLPQLPSSPQDLRCATVVVDARHRSQEISSILETEMLTPGVNARGRKPKRTRGVDATPAHTVLLSAPCDARFLGTVWTLFEG